jgi:hypothetical protein
MSCDICGRGTCVSSFHPAAEQDRFATVIDAFDWARALRAHIHAALDEEARANDEEAQP